MTTEMLPAWRDRIHPDKSSRRMKTSIEKGFNGVSPREITEVGDVAKGYRRMPWKLIRKSGSGI
jgi:hypothetical protein